MGSLRRAWIAVSGEVAWRLPGWPLRFVRSFRDTERASALDMLAAAETTPRRDLRRKYFLHALDERRHAAVFHARAEALGARDDRADAAMADSGVVHHHGMVEGRTLFERLGELPFLAFVHVAERDAVEQFDVYLRRGLPDAETCEALRGILKDEHFHVSYSRAELTRAGEAGRGREVTAALRRVRLDRVRQGWLRASHALGTAMARVWLGVVYVLGVGPLRPFARLERGGWHIPATDPRPPGIAARAQG